MRRRSLFQQLRDVLYQASMKKRKSSQAPSPGRREDLLEQLDTQRRELSALASMYETLCEFTSDGILVIRQPAYLEAVNHAAVQMFGISEIPTPAGKDAILMSTETRTADPFFIRSPGIQELFERARQRGSSENTALHLFPGNGEKILSVHARRIGSGEPGRVFMVLRDISTESQTEAVKRSFVANVSHELRTPIQIIHGYAEMLDSLELADTERSWVQVILRQSERMENLVSDLLMLARLEQNPHAWIRKSWFRVLPVLENAAKTLNLQVGDTFQCTIECPADLEIEANASLVEQAVFNLLSNALQHSRSKSPAEIRAWVEDSSFFLQVRDYGIGIPPADLPHIFERFYRVEKGSAKILTGAGSGLGLAIVKHIAIAHGGSVRVESWAGEGSLFEFHIPAGTHAL